MKLTTTQMHPVRATASLPVFLAMAVLLLLVPDGGTEQFRVVMKAGLQPLLRITSGRTQGVPLSPATMMTSQDPNTQPAQLPSAEVDQASAMLVRLRDEIRKLQNEYPIEAAQLKEPPALPANVIARRAIWQEPTLGLDKGSADGVRLDAGVLHRGVVAGRIVAVGPHTASMALLTHRGMTIGARLLDSRTEGILQGCKNGEGVEQLCRMTVAAREMNAKVGEQVVTSGLDGVFPAGFWLGKVLRIRKTADFQWELDVQPACEETRVESVRVLTIQPPEVPWPTLPNKK